MISILLADDQEELLDITKLFLERGGDLQVDTASSAAIALNMMKEKKYDAIVSDYEMPTMDGIEFLKEIKRERMKKPFIIFTGRSREEIVIEALNSGADFYLQKGADPKVQFAELKNMIHQAVKRKRVEEALLQSETNYRTLVECTEDSIYMVDRLGRYLFMNSHHRNRLSIPDENYKSLIYDDLHTVEESELFMDLVCDVIRKGESIQNEYEREGRWFVRTISPVKNEIVEQTIAVTVVSTEITKTKKLEHAYNQMEAFFQTLIESTEDSIYMVDPECRYLFMNSHHQRRLGILDNSYKGRSYANYHGELESEHFYSHIDTIIKTGKPDKNMNRHDGHCFIRTFSPVRDEKTDAIIAVVVISIDSQER